MLNKSQIETLCRSPLFRDVPPKEAEGFLESLRVFPRYYENGEAVIEQEESQSEICIVLSGAARGEKLTSDGRSITVNEFLPGAVFGDMLSGASEKSPVTVRMTETGEIIRITFSALINGEESFSETRERILRNLINKISGKYFSLQKRLDMLLCPTLRGKIAIYLLNESKNKEKSFAVPHTREEQARLMNCDRSALSRELSRMKAEGLIDFRGRKFEIPDREKLKNISQ